jgi:hypothetical protein
VRAQMDGIMVDEVVQSCVGAAALVDERGFFLEIVQGHLSGLLIHGLLCTRLRSVWRHRQSLVTHPSQGRQVEIAAYPCPAPNSSSTFLTKLTLDVTTTLGTHLRSISVSTPLLVEVLLDGQLRPFFVDIKEYPWAVNVDELFTASRQSSVVYESRLGGASWEGPFDPALISTIRAPVRIDVTSRALLSHFVTYLLRDGKCASIRCSG